MSGLAGKKKDGKTRNAVILALAAAAAAAATGGCANGFAPSVPQLRARAGGGFALARTACRMSAAMEYTALGDSDLQVSKAALGCMTLGHSGTSEAESLAMISAAVDEYGVTLIDTSEVSKHTESASLTNRQHDVFVGRACLLH